MTCPCPKCSAPIELAASQLTNDESPAVCTACKAKVIIVRESFARRAFRKGDHIRCTACGSPLGAYINCPSCKVLYPDYFVADTREAIRKGKRAGKRGGPSIGFEFSLRSGSREKDTGWPAETITKAAPKPVAARKIMVRVISLVVVLAVVAGGVSAYNHYQRVRKYKGTYMTALYCIKSGTDFSRDVSLEIADTWKKKQDAGESFQPLPSADEAAKLNKVKGQADKFVQLMQPPPAEFAQANDRLVKLNGIFAKAQALALAPSGSLPAFRASAEKLQTDFTQAAHELKSNLPASLTEELKQAQLKYKGLREF